MGAKDWFVCYTDRDVASVRPGGQGLDRDATEALVRRLFPSRTVTPVGDGTLLEHANPDDELVYAAVWPGTSLVCTTEVAVDHPSQVDPRFVREGAGRVVYVHAMHSVVDWFALGAWDAQGRLRRALSVSGGEGEVLEDAGARFAFEEPFWAGEHPVTDDPEEVAELEEDGDPVPFHPLELGEAALHHLFGFVFEGWSGGPADGVDPADVILVGYRLGDAQRGSLFGRWRRR